MTIDVLPSFREEEMHSAGVAKRTGGDVVVVKHNRRVSDALNSVATDDERRIAILLKLLQQFVTGGNQTVFDVEKVWGRQVAPDLAISTMHRVQKQFVLGT